MISGTHRKGLLAHLPSLTPFLNPKALCTVMKPQHTPLVLSGVQRRRTSAQEIDKPHSVHQRWTSAQEIDKPHTVLALICLDP